MFRRFTSDQTKRRRTGVVTRTLHRQIWFFLVLFAPTTLRPRESGSTDADIEPFDFDAENKMTRFYAFRHWDICFSGGQDTVLRLLGFFRFNRLVQLRKDDF